MSYIYVYMESVVVIAKSLEDAIVFLKNTNACNLEYCEDKTLWEEFIIEDGRVIFPAQQ